MTLFEKQQNNFVFVTAGQKAFGLGIHLLDNPYKEQPFKRLWEKGYNSAKRKWENRRRW